MIFNIWIGWTLSWLTENSLWIIINQHIVVINIHQDFGANTHSNHLSRPNLLIYPFWRYLGVLLRRRESIKELVLLNIFQFNENINIHIRFLNILTPGFKKWNYINLLDASEDQRFGVSKIFTHLVTLLHLAMLQWLRAQTLAPPTPFTLRPLGHKKFRSLSGLPPLFNISRYSLMSTLKNCIFCMYYKYLESRKQSLSVMLDKCSG